MESLAILIILGIIGTILVGSVMGIVANSKIGRLEAQIKLLTRRLEAFTSSEPATSIKTTAPQAKATTLAINPKTKTAPVTTTKAEPSKLKPTSTPPKPKPITKPKWSFEEEIGARRKISV